ncbi:MAG: sugar phosphate isomerase/epimerase [Bryobacterales bacterium]|nr:sugar phosphate isomerase/epimerase [Bryobacterales bacterium]
MNRRHFLQTGAAAVAGLTSGRISRAQAGHRFPLGINTYCLRALNWPDDRLLHYAKDLGCDAVFLQDSRDPKAQEPVHWREVKDLAARLGLRLETGGSATLPATPDRFEERANYLRGQIRRAAAMGSPLVRTLLAGDRYVMPPGDTQQHIATMVRLLKSVRSLALDTGVKIAVEVHKDLLSWEFRELVEEAGTDFVGIYLDTGNPVFVMEHPLTTVETLGKYALTLHLRDSVVYEHPKGIAVQWVPLGEGTVDFKEIVARARELCPQVCIYSKPITGRPPQVLPVYDEQHWKRWFPRARSADFARFLALAKQGAPYDKPMVVEDLQGRAIPPHFLEAIQHQQRNHVERSFGYARETLGLGLKPSRG